ncbi:hypothetical protein E2C01_077148 [Portunus trituberculatus]|uniref:Uncharacterized protein n=1 Tax=Portunus trituberculatus TaxID=210409 RepID=A0A5B7IKM3_PORTR|nr:hypothetical protein [Portunus trituberculatus]
MSPFTYLCTVLSLTPSSKEGSWPQVPCCVCKGCPQAVFE